ncbi:MAG: hypothetical protein R3F53_28125 [Gammaproteobacteria bacterium]
MPKTYRYYLTLLLLITSSLCRAQSPTQSFDLQLVEPRAYGYTLGDTATRTWILTLRNGYQLDMDSLPQAERVDLWLELDPLQIEHRIESGDSGDNQHYRITLRYRLINLNEPEQLIELPEHTLKISNGQMNWQIPIPPLRLAARQVAPDPASSGLPATQPLLPPPLLDVTPYWRWLGAAAVLGGLGLLGLIWVYALLPWLQRGHRPFARAYRVLRREPADSETALRALHRAFNSTAGGTVFSHNLNDFFSAQPHFAVLRQPITAFFAYSQQRFFTADHSPPPVDLSALARQLRAAERRQDDAKHNNPAHKDAGNSEFSASGD